MTNLVKLLLAITAACGLVIVSVLVTPAPKAAAPAQAARSVPVAQRAPSGLDKSADIQKKRVALIRKYQAAGVLAKIETPGNLPRAYVDAAFHSLTVDDRAALGGLIYAWAFDTQRLGQMVLFVDNYTGKTLATFSAERGYVPD